MSILKSLVLKAADRIEKFGHLKGWYYEDTQGGACCVMGALSIEFNNARGHHRVSEVLSAVRWGAGLGSSCETKALDIIRWNDAPERTQDEVIAALRKGAGYL